MSADDELESQLKGNTSALEPASGSVRGALLWASVGQASFFVLQFGSSVLLAHLLNPREMGVFAIGAATVALVSAIQSLGLNNFLIRADNPDRSLLSTVFTINLALSTVICGGIIGVGLLSAHLFREPGALRVMLWMATTPLITALGLLPSSLLQRENNFRALSMARIASTFVGNAITVLLAFEGFSYMSLAYGWVLTCSMNSLMVCLLAPRHVHLRFGLANWRTVMRFGLGMLMVNGTTQAQRQLLNLVLGRFQGLEAVGLFSRANNLYSLLIENTQTVAMRVFLVDFAAAAREGKGLRERYRAVVEALTALLWPLFAGLAVLSGPCVRLLYGPMWQDLSLPLSLLCISGLFWISIAMAWELFVVANETGRQALIELNRTTVGSVLFLIGCQFSLTAACAMRIGETFYSFFLYRPHITRITSCTMRDLLPAYFRSTILTLIAIVPPTIIMSLYHWSPETPLPWALASALLGAILWFLMLFPMRHPLLAQILPAMRRRQRSNAPRIASEEALAATEVATVEAQTSVFP